MIQELPFSSFNLYISSPYARINCTNRNRKVWKERYNALYWNKEKKRFRLLSPNRTLWTSRKLEGNFDITQKSCTKIEKWRPKIRIFNNIFYPSYLKVEVPIAYHMSPVAYIIGAVHIPPSPRFACWGYYILSKSQNIFCARLAQPRQEIKLGFLFNIGGGGGVEIEGKIVYQEEFWSHFLLDVFNFIHSNDWKNILLFNAVVAETSGGFPDVNNNKVYVNIIYNLSVC